MYEFEITNCNEIFACDEQTLFDLKGSFDKTEVKLFEKNKTLFE